MSPSVDHVRHRSRGACPSDSITGPAYSSCDVDDDVLDRLVLLTVALGDDDLRLADRELVAFAAHRFDEDRKMQLAAAAHFERVGALGVRNAQRDVRFELAHRRSRIWREVRYLPSRPANGEVLTLKNIATVGSSTDDRVNRFGRRRVGDRVADVDAFDAGDADDVAGRRFLDLDAFEPGEREQLGEPLADFDGVAAVRNLGDRRVDARAAAKDAADADASDVLVVVDRADQHLERSVFGRRLGNVLQRSFRRAVRGRRLGLSMSRVAVPALAFV